MEPNAIIMDIDQEQKQAKIQKLNDTSSITYTVRLSNLELAYREPGDLVFLDIADQRLLDEGETTNEI